MNKPAPWKTFWGFVVGTTLIIILAISCGTGTNPASHSPRPDPGPNPSPSPSPTPIPTPTPVLPTELCNCTPTAPDTTDYRHAAKHVPLPGDAPQEITVATILSWQPDNPAPAPDAPRSGRELQLFHISVAYLQFAALEHGDCDIHMELSDVPDKTAPRVIVELPVDTEYCQARGQLQAQLAQHGFTLSQSHGGELPQALAVSVQGLAFEDFPHTRGTPNVATIWELHPAIVTVNP